MTKHEAMLQCPQGQKEETGNFCTSEIPSMSLLDQLRSKRVKLAQEHNRKIKRLDRQINLLESSNAEEIVKEAAEALYSE